MASRPHVVKGKNQKSHKVRRSKSRRRGSYVPMAEQVRMCEEYLQGGPDNSITKISIRFNRDIATVSKIVKSEEMEEYAKKMRAAILTNSAEKIVERIDYEVATKKSKAGAWIAMELAERIGAIPPKVRHGFAGRFDSRQPIDVKLSEEDRVSDIVRKCTEIVMERGKIFGMPLPEIEEVVKDEVTIPLHEKEQAE